MIAPARAGVLALAILALVAPGAAMQAVAEEDGEATVDAVIEAIGDAAETAGLARVAAIDHARLAAEAGVAMPPSRALILAEPELTTRIMALEPRAGLDLPLRMLAFAQAGDVRLLVTGFDFLAARHGLDDPDLETAFEDRIAAVTQTSPIPPMRAPSAGLETDSGIIERVSAHDFETTVRRLTGTVMAQDDTVWFGAIDWTREARAFGVTLPPARLLLFGGPAPGGVAMAAFPAIGLDAFCQKLLALEREDGEVVVLYNNIAAMAELHYGHSAEPHHTLNARLAETFAAALR